MTRWLVVILVAGACGGGGGKPTINCKIKNGLECEVTQPDENAAYKVCWDFEAKCKNGATFKKDKACARVNGSIMTRASWTMEHVTLTGECDEKVSEEIKNVTSEKDAPR